MGTDAPRVRWEHVNSARWHPRAEPADRTMMEVSRVPQSVQGRNKRSDSNGVPHVPCRLGFGQDRPRFSGGACQLTGARSWLARSLQRQRTFVRS